jgi:hypothetical protein
LGCMTFAGVKRNVLMPDDKQWDILFGDEEMGEGAQRKLNMSRIKNEIVPYIVQNTDAFFSSLTLIMVPMGAGGPLEEGRDYHFMPDVDPQTGKSLETGLVAGSPQVPKGCHGPNRNRGNHCQTRGLHCPQGEHDNIICFPRTRSR